MTSALWLQASHVAMTARTPFARMFAKVIGGPKFFFTGARVNRPHDLAGSSRTEAPGDDQSIIAPPQTQAASGCSINEDEQRDEPERPESIFDHCRTPSQACCGQYTLSAAIRDMVDEWLRSGRLVSALLAWGSLFRVWGELSGVGRGAVRGDNCRP